MCLPLFVLSMIRKWEIVSDGCSLVHLCSDGCFVVWWWLDLPGLFYFGTIVWTKLSSLALCSLMKLLLLYSCIISSVLCFTVIHNDGNDCFVRPSRIVTTSKSTMFLKPIEKRVSRSKKGLNYGSRKIGGYNDDAFGLIFLSTSLILQDTIFAGVFLTVSGLAAIVSNSNNKINDKQRLIMPGIVAMISLALRTLSVSISQDELLIVENELLKQELVLCFVSLLWAYQKSKGTNMTE